MSLRIGYIVGSLSSTSINRQVAVALEKLAPEDVELFEIPIKGLPLYERDVEAAGFPASATAFKQAIEGADGVILVTPEHNRTTTAALLSALDWASRPYGQSSFVGKPVAVTGASFSATGTSAAQAVLRSLLPILGAHLHSEPQTYLHLSPESFDPSGEPEAGLKGVLQQFLDPFLAFARSEKVASQATAARA